MQYKLLLLGKFGIESVPKLSLERKTRAILAYLAATAETHPRRFLWELFCPTTRDPAGTLRWHLSRIRREVDENLLHITPQEVALNTAVAQTDLALFQQSCQDPNQANTQSLAGAIDLYRGPFLDGLEPKNMPEFDLWLLGMRTRCQQLYEKGASALIDRYIQQQAYQAAIQQAQQLLQTNALLEANHRQLIWLYAAVGQRESALKQFDHCQALLRQELAVDPSDEILELQAALQNNQPLPPIQPEPAPVSQYVPALTVENEFVGRQAELRQLQERWQSLQRTNKVTILIKAAAGGGKTRLVENFLGALAPGIPVLSGNCYESTRATPYQPWLTILKTWTTQLTPDELDRIALPWKAQLARLLPHLFTTTTGAPEQQEHIFQAVAHLLFMTKRVTAVIFIDDLHWADEASVQLLLFLVKYATTTPSSFLLIGTFRSEEIADNQALQAFLNDTRRDETVTNLSLPPLAENEIDILIRQLWPNIPLTENLSEIKTGLLTETGGNPLFLTELLRELGQTAVLPTPLPIPPSLQELTNHRLQKMPVSSRQVLETLAILDQPAHFDLTQQISGRTEDETLTAFELGLRWHFLRPHPSAHYDFNHELIRNAIKHQLSDIRRQRLHLRAAQALTQRNSESATLAYHWGMAGDQHQEARYTLLAADTALTRAAFTAAIQLYQKAAELLPEREEQDQYQATLGIVKALYATSSTEKLPPYLNRLTTIAGKIGDLEKQAEAATFQARFALLQGAFEKIESIAKQGLELAKSAQAINFQAQLLEIIGKSYRDQGDYATALTFATRALDLYLDSNDRRGQASILTFLGNLHVHQGRHRQAIKVLRQALTLCRQLADPFNQSRVLAWLADALWYLGDYEEVRLVVEEGLSVSQEIEDKKGEAVQFNNLAGLAVADQDPKTAIEYYQKALAIAESINDPRLIAVYNSNIGGAYVGLNNATAALPYLDKAIAVAQEAGLPRQEAHALHVQGCAYHQIKDFVTALVAFEQALALRQELGEQFRMFLTFIQLTETCLELEDIQAAESYLLEAQNIFASLHEEMPHYAHQEFHYTAYLFYQARSDETAVEKHIRLAHQALQARLLELDDTSREQLISSSVSQNILAAIAELDQ